jgi:GNAT superfamily N-acetyltransferase
VSAFAIGELAIPSSVDGADAADFVAMTRVRNRIEAEATGSDDLAMRPAELLPTWQLQDYDTKRMLVARVERSVVGRAVADLPAGAAMAWVAVEVVPEFRRQGIGAALYDGIEQIASEAGRSVLQGYAIEGENGSVDRITAATGFGSVARDSPVARFLLARRFSLEQVARLSRLALPVDRRSLRRRLTAAAAAAGPDYRLHYWSGRTPADRLDQIAALRARLASDAPQGGLEPDVTVWHAARVAAEDDALEASPRERLTAFAEHLPSGAAAGYTQLDVPREGPRPVRQCDTIVLQEHRGRRLGMVLKAGNLLRLEEVRPGHPAVLAFTAEENRHMIAVNETLGFVPWGYEGGWKKNLR